MGSQWGGLALVLLLSTACASDPPAPLPPLVADVGFEGLTLVLLNRDARAFDDCTLVIDPGGYTAPVPHVAPGASARVASDLFANADGQRFNVYTQKPVRFTLLATVNGQAQTWTTAFRYDR